MWTTDCTEKELVYVYEFKEKKKKSYDISL